MVLTAYVALSPVTGLFCHRRLADMFLSLPGRADLNSARLDASVGASGPHDFAVRESVSRQRAGYRSQVFRPTLRSHRAQNAAASTASRPYVRDDHDTPLLWGGMREVLDVIWGVRKQKYFCKEGWTPLSTNRPTGKSPHGSESKFRSCPGRGAASLRCTAEPGPIAEPAMGPGSAAHHAASHSASKTRVNALMARQRRA